MKKSRLLGTLCALTTTLVGSPTKLRPMTDKLPFTRMFGMLLCTLIGGQVQAALITSDIGNTSPGFVDGDTPALLDVTGAQSGQPAPFDVGLGHELFGGNAAGSWQHSYGVISDTILSATLTIGIYDHDSAASGDQVGSFTLDGIDFTSAANTTFNGSGGGDIEYNEYTLSLDSSLFGDLQDGLFDVILNLSGPGLQTDIFGGGTSETTYNSAHYIFSSLEITTSPVPLPHAAWLFGSGLLGLVGIARRKKA